MVTRTSLFNSIDRQLESNVLTTKVIEKSSKKEIPVKFTGKLKIENSLEVWTFKLVSASESSKIEFGELTCYTKSDNSNIPFLYIADMTNKFFDYEPSRCRYKHVGAAILEGAVRFSAYKNLQGSPQLYTVNDTAFFYFKSGYRFIEEYATISHIDKNVEMQKVLDGGDSTSYKKGKFTFQGTMELSIQKIAEWEKNLGLNDSKEGHEL